MIPLVKTGERSNVKQEKFGLWLKESTCHMWARVLHVNYYKLFNARDLPDKKKRIRHNDG